jgi:hypothetical protein
MSTQDENRAVVESVYAAFKAGDFARLAELFDPEIEFVEAEGLPFGEICGTTRGLSNVLTALGTLFTKYLTMNDFVCHFIATGTDMAITVVDMDVTIPATGKRLTVPLRECYRVRDGKVYQIQPFYFDTAALAEAAA